MRESRRLLASSGDTNNSKAEFESLMESLLYRESIFRRDIEVMWSELASCCGFMDVDDKQNQ